MTEVVAIALEGPDARILMQKRRSGGVHGGLWEFPGGKVEKGETRQNALVREVREELGVELAEADLRFVAVAPEDASGNAASLVLILYKSRIWRGEPQCLDAAELAWFAPGELTALDTPPLDKPLIEALLNLG